jgi:hypothetical protein
MRISASRNGKRPTPAVDPVAAPVVPSQESWTTLSPWARQDTFSYRAVAQKALPSEGDDNGSRAQEDGSQGVFRSHIQPASGIHIYVDNHDNSVSPASSSMTWKAGFASPSPTATSLFSGSTGTAAKAARHFPLSVDVAPSPISYKLGLAAEKAAQWASPTESTWSLASVGTTTASTASTPSSTTDGTRSKAGGRRRRRHKAAVPQRSKDLVHSLLSLCHSDLATSSTITGSGNVTVKQSLSEPVRLPVLSPGPSAGSQGSARGVR